MNATKISSYYLLEGVKFLKNILIIEILFEDVFINITSYFYYVKVNHLKNLKKEVL
tara:strand:+ start:122 stop:289 length:168 start_codon:yes stop_codon:yes gene_type:complete